MAANDEKVQESVNQFLSDVKRFALLLFVNCRVIVNAIKGMECSPEFKKSLDTVAGCFEMSASSVTSDSYNPLLAKCTSEVHIAVLVLEFVSLLTSLSPTPQRIPVQFHYLFYSQPTSDLQVLLDFHSSLKVSSSLVSHLLALR